MMHDGREGRGERAEYTPRYRMIPETSLIGLGWVPFPAVKLPTMWKAGTKGFTARTWHCGPCLQPTIPGSQVPGMVPSAFSGGHWSYGRLQ